MNHKNLEEEIGVLHYKSDHCSGLRNDRLATFHELTAVKVVIIFQ